MTNDQLKAIRERCEAATAGPWNELQLPDTSGATVNAIINQFADVVGVTSCNDPNVIADWWFNDYDIEFITHARQDMPDLLDEVERLRKTIESKDREIAVLNRRCMQRRSMTRR